MTRNLFTLLLLIFIIGCAKRKSQTLNLDLTVVESETMEHLKANVCLFYKIQLSNGGVSDKEILIGVTDENGRLVIKRKIEKGAYDTRIVVKGGQYYSAPFNDISIVQAVSLDSKQVKVLKIKPYYYCLINLKNTSCYNQTDSAWIKIPFILIGNDYKRTAIGCADTNYYYPGSMNSYSLWSTEKDIVAKVTTKKNNTIDSFQVSINLQKNSVNPTIIEY